MSNFTPKATYTYTKRQLEHLFAAKGYKYPLPTKGKNLVVIHPAIDIILGKYEYGTEVYTLTDKKSTDGKRLYMLQMA